MGKTVAPITTLEAIDDDIRSAIARRDIAFRRVMAKDTLVNRDVYADACAEVDGLLEMRHGMAHNEGNRP